VTALADQPAKAVTTNPQNHKFWVLAMKLFLSIKYHADHSNREQIEGVTAALRKHGWQTICVTRDIEGWGTRPVSAGELMTQTFAAIDECDLLLVELSEKGVGIGLEAGYAYARNIPIVVVAPTGGDISTTLQGVARRFGWYDDYDEITAFL
jgi:2'-deoxynucleoside 5'-phosphate N-hydrolase